MAGSPHALNWPRQAAPELLSGGRFPMPAHNPGLVYVNPERVALHLHDYTGRLWLGRRPVQLKPGDFTLTPAGLPSHYDLEAPGHHLCVHFAARPAGAAPVRVPLHWRPGACGRQAGERLQEIIQLYRLGAGRGRGAALAQTAAGAALQSLLLWVAVMAGSRPDTPPRPPARVDGVLEEVRRHLDEHYREPLDVPGLARRLGVSQNHLSRRFRSRHGMTMHRYVLGRRVELARHLLTVTRLPIKAVAIEAGLGNPQYFHRQFRSATGRNPSAERSLTLQTGGD